MKKLSRCLWGGVAAVSLLSLAGCGGNKLENQILGSWQMTDKDTGQAMILAYREAGEGTAKTGLGNFDFKWSVVDANKRTITRKVNIPGSEDGAEWEITVEGDKLIERDTEDNDVIQYVRVADDAEVPKIDLGAEMQKSQEESDAANGKLTPTALKNATEDEKKFIEMYNKAYEQMYKAAKMLDELDYSGNNHTSVVAKAKTEFEIAWNTQVNHFGTPPRFYDTNAKLRLALVKMQEGLNGYLNTGQVKGLISEAGKLADDSKVEFERQLKALHNGQ